MVPKFIAVVRNPRSKPRDFPLSSETPDAAVAEAAKYKGSLLAGGTVCVIENGGAQVGAFGR